MPRSKVDGLVEFARELGAGGLAWFKMRGGQPEGGVAKFFSEGEIAALRERFGAEDGALLLFVADQRYVCNLVLSHLRGHLARELGLVGEEPALCWVVEAPAFERDEETGQLTFVHHPFTAPITEDLGRLESDPESVLTHSYDLVMNGQEVAGGSVRISSYETQVRVLKILGYSEEQIQERFGFFINALRYGPPPHGGHRLRLRPALHGDARPGGHPRDDSLPEDAEAMSLLTGDPSEVDPQQLRDLGLRLASEPE